jgi:hypothetical protein
LVSWIISGFPLFWHKLFFCSLKDTWDME